LANKRVARLESAGGVSRLEAFIADDAEMGEQLAKADRRYAAERDAHAPADATLLPAGGVGGNQGEGLKCLHAHYADTAAGNANPVGSIVRPFVEPLDCNAPCVRSDSDGAAVRNPDWREPR
jgi:hypothetical protein